MSWLWTSDPTAEQAQEIVQSLQEEIDERNAEIEALESNLKSEQDLIETLLSDEIKHLQLRKSKLQDEVKHIDILIKKRHAQLTDKSLIKLQDIMGDESNVANDDSDDENYSDAQTLSMTPTREIDAELAKVQKLEPNAIFIIQRSTNSNTVVYSANFGENGSSKLLENKPVNVFWIMFEQRGNPREDLNVIERNSAYGTIVSPDPQGRVGHHEVVLSSIKDRKMHLFVDENGQAHMEGTINGQANMRLERVYVESTTKWGLPDVAFIEFFGYNPQTLENVYEKKFK